MDGLEWKTPKKNGWFRGYQYFWKHPNIPSTSTLCFPPQVGHAAAHSVAWSWDVSVKATSPENDHRSPVPLEWRERSFNKKMVENYV